MARNKFIWILGGNALGGLHALRRDRKSELGCWHRHLAAGVAGATYYKNLKLASWQIRDSIALLYGCGITINFLSQPIIAGNLMAARFAALSSSAHVKQCQPQAASQHFYLPATILVDRRTRRTWYII
ncbi:hypothetical protein C8J57DRAFT_1224014 [Mycena rebaudengoi]|nr:hypothetical protein C8J57DRAFT_1224014 [Mycena rebaudengoi]